jgi:hypothetical protein
MSDGNVQVYGGYAGPAGKVVNIIDATGQDSTGRYVTGKNVTYQLKSGLSGTVFVPNSLFNEDAVRAAVMADAARLHAASQITFGS